MNFTQREKQILKYISQNYPNFVAVESLSDYLDVSSRTIQRDLKQLEKSLKSFEIKLVKKQNKGITLKHENLLQLIEEILMSDNIDLNQVQRVIAIYQEFLFNDDFTTINYLTTQLKVSHYTINLDVDLLAEMLISANVVIRKKPGVGLELDGLEKDKRNGFTHLMSYYFQQENSFSIQKNEFQMFKLQTDESELIDSVQKILFQELKQFPYAFTDQSLYNLWMYLVISILRQQNHLVELTQKSDDINNLVARDVYHKLGFKHNFSVQENEILYLASLLRSAKRVNEKIDLQTDNLLNLARELIGYVSESTGYYIEQSPQFIHGLITHLRPLLYRIQEGIFVGNPIKTQIKEDYPQLFLSLQHYFENHVMIDVNEDEIGFLTLHFGVNIDSLKSVPNVRTLVICTSGIATSRMLTKKLLDHFPQMTIIEQSSLLDLNHLEIADYDLIISTVKLNQPDFEYIHINALLGEAEYLQIEQKVNSILLNPKQFRQTSRRIIHLDDQLVKIQEVLDIAKQLLANINVLTINCLRFEPFISQLDLPQDIKDDLLKKQERIGFAIPKSNIALVHTRSHLIDDVKLWIYQNRSDMVIKGMSNENEKIDTILVLITPLELTNEQLELISFISITLLEEKYVRIYSRENEETIIDFFKNQLAQSLQNTIKKIWR